MKISAYHGCPIARLFHWQRSKDAAETTLLPTWRDILSYHFHDDHTQRLLWGGGNESWFNILWKLVVIITQVIKGHCLTFSRSVTMKYRFTIESKI